MRYSSLSKSIAPIRGGAGIVKIMRKSASDKNRKARPFSYLKKNLRASGNGVIASLGKRVTPQHAFYGKPKPLLGAVFFNGLHGINGAGRNVAARRGQKRGNKRLISPYRR